MGEGDPKGERVATGHPTPRQGEIDTGIAGQARQKKSRADIGEKADACFRHGEGEMFARDDMRAVHGDPGAAAHDDPIGQRDVRFGIELDAAIEAIFLAPKAKLLGIAPGLAEIIQDLYVAARAKSLAARARYDDASDSRIALPPVQRARHLAHHIQGQRIECLGTAERDEAATARLLASDFGFANGRLGPRGKRPGRKITIMLTHRVFTIPGLTYLAQA